MTDIPELKCPACRGRGSTAGVGDTLIQCASCRGTGVAAHPLFAQSNTTALAAAQHQTDHAHSLLKNVERFFLRESGRGSFDRRGCLRLAERIHKAIEVLDETPDFRLALMVEAPKQGGNGS